MKLSKRSLMFTLLICILSFCYGQNIKHLYGDTAYISVYQHYEKELDYNSILNIQDTLVLRMWNGGKAFTINMSKDSVFGTKSVYAFRSSKKGHKKCDSWTTIFENYKLDTDECNYINERFKEIRTNLISFEQNDKIIDRKQGGGGSVSAIEFCDNTNYILLTKDIFDESHLNLIDSIMNVLELDKIENEFKINLKKGFTYNQGGTSSIHYATSIKSIFQRAKNRLKQ